MKRKNIAITALLLALTVATGCSAGNIKTTSKEESKTTVTLAQEESSDSTQAPEEEASGLETAEKTEDAGNVEQVSEETGESAGEASGMFTERDLSSSYEAGYEITLSDNGSEGQGVSIDGNVITITQEGTYILYGALSDGQIVVDAADENAKIQLVLNGVSISKSGSAAIYVKQADKVFITAAEGTENTLTSTGAFEADGDENVDAVIYAKDDITLNGSGSLTVISEQRHGIAAKDDIKITDGTIIVEAAQKGIDANDSVRIAGGDLTITSGEDSIHVENTDDTSLGYFYMADGMLVLTAQEGDGIDASSTLTVDGGSISILSGGGYEYGEVKYDWDPGMTSSKSDSDEASLKGIKAETEIVLNGGNIAISSADDAIHCNNDVLINGSGIQIAAGDDAIHADNSLTIKDGDIDIYTSREGLEGLNIEIDGGYTDITASDDAVNASGSASASLIITGGTISMDSSGDGLDSNGSMDISGGVIYVNGPTNDGNAALDYDGQATVTGGTIVATGSSGMAMNFSQTSAQGCILLTCGNQEAGTDIIVYDSDGNEVLSYSSTKAFSSVVLSSPDIVQGETYTISIGDTQTTIEMTSLLYGQGSGMGMGMGGFGGGIGAGPGARR